MAGKANIALFFVLDSKLSFSFHFSIMLVDCCCFYILTSFMTPFYILHQIVISHHFLLTFDLYFTIHVISQSITPNTSHVKFKELTAVCSRFCLLTFFAKHPAITYMNIKYICLSQWSIALKRHHDHDNCNIKKH